MAKRIILIGQAPSKDTDGKAPFSGKSGAQLAAWAGVEHEELGIVFDLRNLFNSYLGKTKVKGDVFPVERAKDAAVALRPELRGRKVVMIGYTVAKAFSYRDREPFKWFRVNGTDWCYIPHPSGVNLLYNDPKIVKRAQKILKEAARESRKGLLQV